jgi:hypothetical protein
VNRRDKAREKDAYELAANPEQHRSEDEPSEFVRLRTWTREQKKIRSTARRDLAEARAREADLLARRKPYHRANVVSAATTK